MRARRFNFAGQPSYEILEASEEEYEQLDAAEDKDAWLQEHAEIEEAP